MTLGDALLLLVEAALAALAWLHWRPRGLPRLTLWVTLALIAGTIPVSVLAIGVAGWEMSQLPWTRPDNAFGTYWEPTGLLVLGVAVDGLLWMIAAVLAFVRPRGAAALYLALGLLWIADAARLRLVTPASAPLESTIGGLIMAAIPALLIAALLASLRTPLLDRLAHRRA